MKVFVATQVFSIGTRCKADEQIESGVMKKANESKLKISEAQLAHQHPARVVGEIQNTNNKTNGCDSDDVTALL